MRTPCESDFSENFEQINFDRETHINLHYNKTESIEKRFKTWWTCFATFIVDHPFDMLDMDQLTTTHLYKIIGNQPSMAFYSETKNILMMGQEEGLFKLENISLINQFVRVAITNVVKTNIAAGKTPTKAQIDWVVNACWDGVIAR
jgi:hypothetical protein